MFFPKCDGRPLQDVTCRTVELCYIPNKSCSVEGSVARREQGETRPTLTSCLCKPSDTGSLAVGDHILHILGGRYLNMASTQTATHRNNSSHKHNPKHTHLHKQTPTQTQTCILIWTLPHRHPSTNTLIQQTYDPTQTCHHTDTLSHKHPHINISTPQTHSQTNANTQTYPIVTSPAQTHTHMDISLQIPMPHMHSHTNTAIQKAVRHVHSNTHTKIPCIQVPHKHIYTQTQSHTNTLCKLVLCQLDTS